MATELLELRQDDGGALSAGEARQGRVNACAVLLTEQALLGCSPRTARVMLERPGG